MKTPLKIIVALVCVVYGLFALASGVVMMTSSEMTERYVGGNYSPAVAGAIGLLMASLFFASAFFIFRRPVVTVAILAALMLIQVLALVVADTGAAPVDVVTGVMLVLSFVIWRGGTTQPDTQRIQLCLPNIRHRFRLLIARRSCSALNAESAFHLMIITVGFVESRCSLVGGR